jgi:hypothetical protein
MAADVKDLKDYSSRAPAVRGLYAKAFKAPAGYAGSTVNPDWPSLCLHATTIDRRYLATVEKHFLDNSSMLII